ncbi:hypothetical protein [Yoonia sp. SS1-5]|uniref:Lipoprotein n=1 Tax=Yoonia rhodophyticola TaxID=3137370 RepID=A0AAN0MDP5_9RHOB
MTMTKFAKLGCVMAGAVLIAGCEVAPDGSRGITDTGIDGGPLEDGVASIWVDPDGCQHWFIDDGIEGYMSPRLNRDGTPRCDAREDTRTTMLTKDGSSIIMEPEPNR